MDIRKFMKAAKEQGWRVILSHNGHYKWYPPRSRRFCVTPSTCSDWRGVHKALADLRRLGLVYPR